MGKYFYRNGMQENRNFLWHNNVLLDTRGNADVLRSLSGFPLANLHADLQGTGFAETFMEDFLGFLAALRDRSGNPDAKKVAGEILKRTSLKDATLPELSAREADILAAAVVKPYLDGLGVKRWFRYPVLKEWQIMSAEEKKRFDLEEYRKFLIVVRDSSGDEHAAKIAAEALSRPLEADGKLSVRDVKDLGASISFPYPNDEGAIRRCSFTATKEWKEYVSGLNSRNR